MYLKKLIVPIAVSLGLLAFGAQAQQASNDELGLRSVATMGTQSLPGAVAPFTENLVFVRFDPPLTQQACAFGVVYFDPTTPLGRNLYASVLTARAAGIQVSRVVYKSELDVNNNLICTIDQLLELAG